MFPRNQNRFNINLLSSSPLLLFSRRFCSSSSISPESFQLILQQTLHNTSQKKWTPIRSVASSLSDDALEAVSEIGGLRKFIEGSAEAASLFEIKMESNGVPVIMQKPQKVEKSSTNLSKIDLDDLPAAPPPSSSSSSVSHRKNPQNHNNNNCHQFFEQSSPSSTTTTMNKTQLQKERQVVSCIPSFAIPLVEAVRMHLEEKQQEVGDGDKKKSTKAKENILVSMKDVQSFLQEIRNANAQHIVDLFFPCSGNPYNVIAGLPNDDEKSLKRIQEQAFVSILPPYINSHLDKDTEDIAAQQQQNLKVADYDMCRLARFLSNDSFVFVSSLLKSTVPSLLTKPILHIIASFPNHFEYVQPNAALPEGTVCGDVVSICAAMKEAGCPPVSVSMMMMQDDQHQDNNSYDEHSLGYVRFILNPTELEHGLGGVPEKIRRMDFNQLTGIYKHLINRKLSKEDAIALGPQFGLSKVPTGMARVKFKHQVIRSMVRLRFPKGNPFFDRNVFAHYIFDHLPETKPVCLLDWRETLPESGRTAAPLAAAFLQSYPHLFAVAQDDRNEWILQRADAEGKDRIPTKDWEQVTEEEVLMAIWLRKPANYSDDQASYAGAVFSMLPMNMQNKVRQHLGGMSAFMRRYPEQFEMHPLQTHSDSFWWKKKPPTGILLNKNNNKNTSEPKKEEKEKETITSDLWQEYATEKTTKETVKEPKEEDIFNAPPAFVGEEKKSDKKK